MIVSHEKNQKMIFLFDIRSHRNQKRRDSVVWGKGEGEVGFFVGGGGGSVTGLGLIE